jgi:hypothetical protein
VSGEAGKRKGTPWPKAFGRLQTGPTDRTPAACQASSADRPGSIASAPSRCSTTARLPSARQRSSAAPSVTTATAPSLAPASLCARPIAPAVKAVACAGSIGAE